MAKYCKNCGKLTPPPHLTPFCSLSCHITGKGKTIKRTQLKRPTEIKIKQKSSTNKNTPAKFNQNTKYEIRKRQIGLCIISGDPIEAYHHAYHGANANRSPNRNDPDQGVGISNEIHRIIHFASPKEAHLAKIYRAKCIIYLKEYYKNKK